MVRQAVSSGDVLHTFQPGRVRHSVYPIATAFYCQRRVHVLHAPSDWDRVAAQAGRPFCVLIRSRWLAPLRQRGQSAGYDVSPIGAEGDVALVRVIPGATKVAYR